MAKKLFIKSYGCQMNVYDSTRMVDVLAPEGYEAVPDPDGADVVILNTCHIREKAAEKVYSELGRLRQLKQQAAVDGRQVVLAVAGCVAQAEGAEMIARAPQLDLVFGPQVYHRLPTLIEQARERPVVAAEFPAEAKFDALPAPNAPGLSAFLTIQEGCDKFCAFCVVPYTRGAEYSRPAADVLDEARVLVDGGAREITLLGQNVNAYLGAGPDGAPWDLARLIGALAAIDGLARIRYTTSHPRDMHASLIEAHGAEPKLMPYLHLPVQSGSDSVLTAMNRRHDAAAYLGIVEKLRAARPDIALSSDFIVGFPGETDADFEATLELVRKVGYAQAYSFKYSPRPGTPAATAAAQIPEADKAARLAALQALLNQQQADFNASFQGRTIPILLERPGRHDRQLVGRSPWMQAVHVDFADPAARGAALGQIVMARIESAHANSLHGVPIGAPPDGDMARTAPPRQHTDQHMDQLRSGKISA